MIKKGDKGSNVKEIQEMLSITADGVFGNGTELAVKKFQSDNGLTNDGIVGPKTYEVMVKQTKEGLYKIE